MGISLPTSRRRPVSLSKRPRLQDCQLSIWLDDLHHPVERFGSTVALKVLLLSGSAMPITGQRHYNVAARLHDLVKCLLLRGTKKDADAVFLGAPLDFCKRRVDPIGQANADFVKLVDETVIDDVAKDPGVLSNPLRLSSTTRTATRSRACTACARKAVVVSSIPARRSRHGPRLRRACSGHWERREA